MGLSNNLGKLSNTITSNGSAAALGVTPSAWSGFNALQVSSLGLWSTTANNSHFSSNLYYDGTNRLYITSDYATEYSQQTGVHKWYVAGSGTAGGTVSLTQAMTLLNNGNLGIGITSPSAPLHVAGGNTTIIMDTTSASFDASIRFNNNNNATQWAVIQAGPGAISGGGMNIYTTAAYPLLLSTNGTSRVQVPATSTSATLGSGGTLKVIGNGVTGYTELQFYTYNAPTNQPPVSLGLIKTDNGGYENGEFYIATKASNANIAPVERVRVTSSGYFKACNFASPSYSNNYHQFYNNVYGDWIAEVAQFNTVPYGLLLTYRNASPRGSGNEMMYFNDSTGNVFKIGSNGNCYNLNNVYTALSDIKLKENIEDATPKLDKLMQVKIRNYNLKTDPNLKQIGVIAQELQEVFPGLIEENFDRDADNQLNGETTLGVKYSVFVPILIKAMQEQQEIINNLSAKVTALENK